METVGESGQRIIEREPRSILGRSALRRDVGAAAAIAAEIAPVVVVRPPRNRPPAIVALKGAAQGQIVEFGLAREQEWQRALPLAMAFGRQEQIGERRAEQFAARPAHQARDGIGDIGQPALGIGRPEPAAAAFLVILEQQQRFAGVQIGDRFGTRTRGARAELAEQAATTRRSAPIDMFPVPAKWHDYNDTRAGPQSRRCLGPMPCDNVNIRVPAAEYCPIQGRVGFVSSSP